MCERPLTIMEQLKLLPDDIPYDKVVPYCDLDRHYGFSENRCFNAFVNFNYWGNPYGWILQDFRDEYERLTGVFIVIYVLDGGIE